MGKVIVRRSFAFLIGVGLAFVSYYPTYKKEKTKRKEFRYEVEKEVVAINRASAVVVDRIRCGHHYEGKTLQDIYDDFAFEQIAQHDATLYPIN